MLVASEEVQLEVNVDRTQYMIMSRDQTAQRSHNMKIDNSSYERVEEFMYVGKTLINQNSIQEEIKRGLHSECLLSFSAESFVLHVAV